MPKVPIKRLFKAGENLRLVTVGVLAPRGCNDGSGCRLNGNQFPSSAKRVSNRILDTLATVVMAPVQNTRIPQSS
jgi:hypothetical protein